MIDQKQKKHILLNLFKEILNNEKVNLDDNFFDLGGDSIGMLICISRANENGIPLTIESFKINPCVSHLICLQNHNQPKKLANSHGHFIPLLPIQKKFFEKPLHSSNAKLIPRYAKVKKNIDVEKLKICFKKILYYHEALNLRFKKYGDEWKQFLVKENNFYFDFLDLSNEDEDKKISKYILYLERQLSEFSLDSGYLVKFLLVDWNKNEPYQFILAAHHLCMDGYSHPIILDDIASIYKNKKPIHRSTSFSDWAEFVFEYSKSKEVLNSISFWTNEFDKNFGTVPVDNNNNKQKNYSTDIAEYYYKIDIDLNKELTVFKKKNSSICVFDFLVSGFLLFLNEVAESNFYAIDIRRHGRDFTDDKIHLEKTVGWLTLVYPVAFVFDKNASIDNLISYVHDKIFNVPKNGISHGILSFFSEKHIRSKMDSLFKPEIAFNYHGIVDAFFLKNDIFSFFKKTPGNNSGSKTTRNHLLNIDIMIHEKQTHIFWTYNQKIHNKEKIELFSSMYFSSLKKMINYFHSKAPL